MMKIKKKIVPWLKWTSVFCAFAAAVYLFVYAVAIFPGTVESLPAENGIGLIAGALAVGLATAIAIAVLVIVSLALFAIAVAILLLCLFSRRSAVKGSGRRRIGLQFAQGILALLVFVFTLLLLIPIPTAYLPVPLLTGAGFFLWAIAFLLDRDSSGNAPRENL